MSIVAAVVGWLLSGEALPASALLPGVVILAGVALVTAAGRVPGGSEH